jgi:glutathione S-transferase
MLKLWGRTSSINVRKVLWTLQELGIPFERTDAGLQYGIVQTPEYRKKNPNSLVPVLEDDGFVLWESNVIVRYLCSKHSPGDLCPSSLPERFEAERWMDWQQTRLNRASQGAFIQFIRTPAEQRDPALIEQSVAATEPLLAMVDHHLSRNAFLAGARFTMGDIPIACEMHRWSGLPRERVPLAHLERWYEVVRARPAARGVLDLTLA